ncbi:unnamed protein product [Pseudo-nitzschia multistriata]|uniref:NADP-dependent oxidoreductase domain-containing protein n=1 Tax=Pseudo-nitzschia multistriata TaxID=183589 RepID=A0A448ZEE0_9STRA|nr:unnamed protein product [Pseudo-nitzschia multistriata]
MRYSSFFYLSCLLVAIDRPWQIHARGFFGRLLDMVTGEGGGDHPVGGNSNSYSSSNSNSTGSIKIGTRRTERADGGGGFPTARLSNGVSFPLVGLGAGNLPPEAVQGIVAHGLAADKNVRLIDTARVSQNEFLVARGIVEGAERLASAPDKGADPSEVHVVTKVWYTHLGYERTLLSARSSLEALAEARDHPGVDLRVHLLLHWPRCYDEIPWMDCAGEEEGLPPDTRAAGPAPHLDPAGAWKGSWRALEELLADPSNPIASIGVSNFHRRDLEELEAFAAVRPQLLETSAWSLLYDPLLIEFCHKWGIHVVAHNLMEGVLYRASEAPFASHHLLSVANDLSLTIDAGKATTDPGTGVSAAQVVLAWLVQHSISVIPMTTDLSHLGENSAVALSRIPAMDDRQVRVVAESVEALISGDDLTEDAFVTVTFHARSKDVFLYWHDPEFGGEIEVARIDKGTSFEESSHPGHEFKIYDVEGGGMEFFRVAGNYGEHKHIEL